MAADPEPARPEEWAEAFRLLFRHLADEDRARRVADALALIERGELNPDGVFVLRAAGELAGVLTCLPLPGALALVWPPQCRADIEQKVNEDRLLQHALRWLHGQGIKLTQTLFAPDDVIGAEALERNGFVHLTHLWFLRHSLDVPTHCLATPARLEFVTSADDRTRFAETMVRSYELTLDCPEINDVRSAEEILAGHRSQGVHDPGRWWLATHAGRPVGVLLATLMPETGEWDVEYVGIVPAERRRGFGRELMLKVLFEARAANAPSVTLSVDGRNDPAWNLYRALGFEAFDRREVYLAIRR